MQQTSAIYQELLARYQAGDANVKVESRLAIGNPGVLITKQGEGITFGGVSILVGISGGDGGYDESLLVSMKADFRVFAEDTPTVGSCVAAEIDVEMVKPFAEIPRQACMIPYVRLTDGEQHSEWIQKGVFYIDTRDKKEDGSSIEKIQIHGYDDMLKAEQDYPSSAINWPARDIDVVREIASFMDIPIDARTLVALNRGYAIQYPANYSCREVLGYIAAMYAGCFVMSETGELRLITLYGIPPETRYLVDGRNAAITFGGVRILV